MPIPPRTITSHPFARLPSGSLEGSPLPTAWSGEGEREQVPIRLAPGDLERAGRHAIAEQVRGARDRGIDAWGWLPADPGGGSLAGYARRVGAGVVLVPDDLESPDLLERLTGGSATGVSDELQPQIELRVVPT